MVTYGLPLEILVRSMAAAAIDKAACLASSSEWYRLSEAPATGVLRPESTNSALDVQSPSGCCRVVMMTRCPW
jgi:hypothetical protein